MKELKEKIVALKQQYINQKEYAKSALLREIEKDLFPEPKWKEGDEHMMISDVESVYKEEAPVIKTKEELKISSAQEASKYVKEGDRLWVEMEIADISTSSDYSIAVSDGVGELPHDSYPLSNKTKIAYKP